MPSLRELQREFVNATLFATSRRVHEWIDDGGIPTERRVAIYANNARYNFCATLAAAFSVVRDLGGADWFDQTARQYMRAHPSTSGNLHQLGHAFAPFLEEQLHATDYAYFSDVARLEWAYQEVLVAADREPLQPTALAHVPPVSYGELRFEAHPAIRVVRSTYPILSIWQAHRDDASLDRIHLSSGSHAVLVARQRDHVSLKTIDPLLADFHIALERGASLQDATDQLLAIQPDWDLSHALSQLFGRGMFSAVSFPPGDSSP